MNSPGYKSQRDCDNSYIYLCVENNVWIRIPIETSWADTYITPTSSSNGDGIIYRLGYMYMYVSRHNFNKWVRYPVETSWVGSSILLSSETLPTSYFSYSNPYLYWTVMVSNTDDYICPNVIPFLETYHGIWELNKPAGEVWCSNHSVWDQVSTSILIRFPYEYIREYPPNRIIENGDNKIFSVDENQIREEGLFIRDECDITSTLVN